MNFTNTQKALFDKNLKALKNPILKQDLSQLKTLKFKIILGKHNLDINIIGGGVRAFIKMF
ncbi:hypothetical protein [Campylobacter novaezeelandiae]|uniref:hypothetical protein n=1 Tax=Campylobacter novaezeelandiae TaxID=2267891 RepID=UPI001C1DEC9C|nr:hypothetical protein [Campylobacter novaezeelandiae]